MYTKESKTTSIDSFTFVRIHGVHVRSNSCRIDGEATKKEKEATSGAKNRRIDASAAAEMLSPAPGRCQEPKTWSFQDLNKNRTQHNTT